jgi:hypothetical protein
LVDLDRDSKLSTVILETDVKLYEKLKMEAMRMNENRADMRFGEKVEAGKKAKKRKSSLGRLNSDFTGLGTGSYLGRNSGTNLNVVKSKTFSRVVEE